MKYFKFTKNTIIKGTNYRKGDLLQINVNNEVINKDNSWLFDIDSPLAKELGIVIREG